MPVSLALGFLTPQAPSHGHWSASEQTEPAPGAELAPSCPCQGGRKDFRTWWIIEEGAGFQVFIFANPARSCVATGLSGHGTGAVTLHGWPRIWFHTVSLPCHWALCSEDLAEGAVVGIHQPSHLTVINSPEVNPRRVPRVWKGIPGERISPTHSSQLY